MRLDWLITFRSITFAQRGERSLQKMGMETKLSRTPKALAQRGCGYCLYVSAGYAPVAVELLRNEQIPFVAVYGPGRQGTLEQRAL